MQRTPFEPPTDHYDERIEVIDEEICHIISKREESDE
jgi:hypothetical protein